MSCEVHEAYAPPKPSGPWDGKLPIPPGAIMGESDNIAHINNIPEGTLIAWSQRRYYHDPEFKIRDASNHFVRVHGSCGPWITLRK